jgi:threonine dehydrogenase-like Zn-dependent dehydrogenase
MKRARALQFIKPGRVELVELDVPEPGPGVALVRMLASSTCNSSELRSERGGQPAGYGSAYPMAPGEPGHEGVGEVIAVGDEVTELAVGDLVAMTGHGGDPTHRSLVLKDAATLARIEPGERDPKAASFLEMFGCAYHCLRAGWREPEGFDGARVVVVGAGAIGLCSVQVLRLWPAAAVVALDVNPARLELAAVLGATETARVPADVEPERFAETVSPADVAVECSGRPEGHRLAQALGARAVINVSYCPRPFPVSQARWFVAGTTIYNPGVLSSCELKAVAALYNRGLLDPAPMVSRRIPPDPAAYRETLRAIGRGEIVKALIDWDAA